MGAKIPQQSSSRRWLQTAATIIRKLLKNGAVNQEVSASQFYTPIFSYPITTFRTIILFKLLSEVSSKKTSKKNIAPRNMNVNPNLRKRGRVTPGPFVGIWSQADPLCGDMIAKHLVVLHEQNRRFEFHKQFLNLHSRDNIDIVHGFVPDVQMGFLAD